MSPERIEKKAIDGETYPLLEAPCSVDLQVVQYAKENVDSYSVHHLYVPCPEISRKLLPLNANLREPEETSQVADMRTCLNDTPNDFFKLNNGMTLLCESVTQNGLTCGIVFGQKEGVCNGGHTYYAILTSNIPDDSKAVVHLELLELPKDMDPIVKLREIVRIARARNNNNRITQRSEADYLKYYSIFKKFLPNTTYVVWHEGDSAALPDISIKAEEYVRLLSAMDPDQYFHPVFNEKGDIHKTAVMAIASIHNGWFTKMEQYHVSGANGTAPLEHMAVLGEDIFELRDHIAESLLRASLKSFRITSLYQEQIKDTTRILLTDQQKKGHDLPPTLEVLIMGLFRTDVWLHLDSKNNIDLSGWLYPPKELWDKRCESILLALGRLYKDLGADPKNFIRSQTAYTFYPLGPAEIENEWRYPRIIFEVSTGNKYERANVSSNPTHYIVPDSPSGMLPIDISHQLPPEAMTYKFVGCVKRIQEN